MCEYRYEFEQPNSRSRFTLTTAQTEAEGGFQSLPRLSSGYPVSRIPASQQSYNTMYQSGSSGNGLRYGRGASAGPHRP